MEDNFESNQIRINTRDFELPIPAKVCGDIAIHKTIGPKRHGYTVTHLRSGLSFCQNLPEADAYKLAKDIMDTKIDLSELKIEDIRNKNPKYKQIAELVLPLKGTPEKLKEWV